ncbi:CHAP domain-containing protein [soil metagenome]
MLKKILKFISALLILLIIVYFIFLRERYPINAITHSFSIGDVVDSYNGVNVYNNGTNYPQSHGKHYSKDSSYYYGKKWQCVEFIKRYYYDYFHHKMTNGFGNAKDFFDVSVKQGQLNKARGLLQFKNDSTSCPEINDILIFGGLYGHIAIVTNVTNDEIEIIQQNIYMTPREKFKLTNKNGVYTVGENRKPEGWLRMK